MSAIIRPAYQHEALLLSELALRSKAYWGYDADFLAACGDDLSVTAADVAGRPVYVLEVDGHIHGFYSLKVEADHVLLADLFVEPESIGRGFGKQLWLHAVAVARQDGVQSLLIHSDPHAAPFYQAMGAEQIGEITSTVVAGRTLPLMRFALPS